ncbi:phosphonate ABC transporter ATP-binding protein [Sediminivirga luteola]|uniref:Phosphonates import ATP-binding protein PhnC n=1 Tax=Sediminivirga luteola TaxID=1774748 RepID=A0A8J2XGQ8_9MICO|nr:phosphonate ABC transporter ATP-binding protein [Sediminivirga luteola]MCI2265841.1 phosphonate ABC transporter ATP-binding protein [Sediminivirga luteola]GGA14201.1 phosphonates import ATP-binding protein PhnC [Sediminivirga luteola]
MTSGANGSAAVPAAEPWGIELKDVTVRYPDGTLGLNGVTLSIAPGEMVAIVGLSGSGKSTLIRAINGLVPVTAGEIAVGGHRVEDAGARALRRLRGEIGMIFQSFNLAGRTSVQNNVLVGRLAHTPAWRTLLGWYRPRDLDLAHRALARVGMLEKLYNRADALSGGQQQRVAIARALAQEPRVLLADEPVASLDPPTAHTVMRDLSAINRDLGITVLVNLHALDLARRYGVRLIGMRAGTVVYDGAATGAGDDVFEQIYDRPIRAEDRVASITGEIGRDASTGEPE